MRKLPKTFAVMLASLLVVGAAGLLLLFAFYPSTYVLRVLKWGNADVHDYLKFPSHPVHSQAPVYSLPSRHIASEKIARAAGLDNLDTFLSDTGTQAFIIVQAGAVVYERYFNGTNRDSIVTSFSVAKSFTSALIGKAIADGYINSVNDPITRYLPELARRDKLFGEITIYHLLTMSSGIKYEEYPFGDNTKTYYYPNLRLLALDQTSVVSEPGKEFLYNNYHPLFLGLILERTTRRWVAKFLEETIWNSLGMEFDASWSIDSEASGFEKMESGINARAIDFAKFGMLYLDQGMWEGKQIIPKEWVVTSTARWDASNVIPAGSRAADGKRYYKYMWWGMERDDQNYDFAALGNYGQFIYVCPLKRVVIVRNGKKYGVAANEWLRTFYAICDGI